MNFHYFSVLMVTEEKIREIKRQLRRGVPEGEIKETLKQEGFSPEEIKQVFRPHHYDMRSWYLGFGIIIFVAGLYIFITRGALLILILSVFMFFAWYYEIERLKKLKNLK